MSRNTPHDVGQWVRRIPSDCTADNVRWEAFLNGRPARPFDAYKFINWRLFWEFSGGNVTENMVHQIAWIMSALELPLPTSAYMSGGVFSEKDRREVPDTIAVTLDFPNDLVVTWQSTFSNSHYGLGDRILGSDGTIEHLAGVTDMVTGKAVSSIWYYPEKVNQSGRAAVNWISLRNRRAHGQQGVSHQATRDVGECKGGAGVNNRSALRCRRCTSAAVPAGAMSSTTQIASFTTKAIRAHSLSHSNWKAGFDCWAES